MKLELIQIIAGALGALGFSILFNVRRYRLLLCTLGGGAVWALNLAMIPAVDSEPWRFFVCAAFATVYAELLARLDKTPAATYLMPVLIPLIPGGALYHTMRFAVEKAWLDCLRQGLHTFKLAIGIAMGIIAVHSLFVLWSSFRTRPFK